MKPWRVLSATEDLRMSKPKAKAKPKNPAKPKAEPKPLLGETAFCGALVNLSLSPRPETPHKHACTCSAFYSSDPVCHFCSCSACDTASAEFARLSPKPTDFELLKRKLNDFGCQCRFEGEHDGVRCEELDHDPCLVCLVNRVEISPGVTASGSRVTPLDATPRDGAASEATSATAPGDLSKLSDPKSAFWVGREAVLLEVATACGNSGDMYIERAEHWIRETFGLEARGT